MRDPKGSARDVFLLEQPDGTIVMWTCPKCGAKIDPSFDVCWRCGTSPDGSEDPNFVCADDVGPIEEPPVAPTLESIPEDPIDSSTESELVECYQAYSLMEAQFVADQLSSEGIPAVADTHDMQDALGGWSGNPRVWVREEDLPRARAWLEAYDARRKAEHGRGESGRVVED